MKQSYFRIGLGLVIVWALFANFNSFLIGDTPGIWGIGATVVYIATWALFLKCSRYRRKDLLFSIVWSAATLACSVMIVIQSLNERLMLTLVIPFAMIFITPLYAIVDLFRQSGLLLEGIALTTLSLIWVVVSAILWKRAE